MSKDRVAFDCFGIFSHDLFLEHSGYVSATICGPTRTVKRLVKNNFGMRVVDRELIPGFDIFDGYENSFFHIADGVGVAGVENFPHEVGIVNM